MFKIALVVLAAIGGASVVGIVGKVTDEKGSSSEEEQKGTEGQQTTSQPQTTTSNS